MAKADRVEDALGQAVEDIGAYIRKQREGAQVSLRQLAKVAGISNPYLSQIERGLRKPSAEILAQIATGLRISAEALYVRAGILEEGAGKAEVETAVMADPDLTERQRRVLLDIYASFRSENAREADAEATAGAPATDQPTATSPRATRTTSAGAATRRPRATKRTGPRTTSTTRTPTTNRKSTGGQ